MPQRFLRPGIVTSKRFNACSWLGQAFYIRLLTLVDDFGRYEADAMLLKSHAFPLHESLRSSQIEALCKELSDFKLAIFYRADGKDFLALTKWIEKPRASHSRYPDPDGCEQLFTNENKCSPPSPSPSPPSSPSPSGGMRAREGLPTVEPGKPAAIAATPTPIAEAFGGDSEPEPAVAVAVTRRGPGHSGSEPSGDRATAGQKRSAGHGACVENPPGPKPPKLEGVPGTNKPTLESALAWFAWVSQTSDERYMAEEVRAAYRTFEAAQGPDGNWWWGKRLVGDWRPAMTTRILDDRQKRGGKLPAMSAGDAMVRAIRGVRVRQEEVEKD